MFCVLNKRSFVVLGPDWPVNVDIVQVGQGSPVYQVRDDLHLFSLHSNRLICEITKVALLIYDIHGDIHGWYDGKHSFYN